MIQKDFVLRQIQQLLQVMAHVLQLKREGRQVEAQTEIDNVFLETFGQGINELLELEASALTALCTSSGTLNADMVLVFAELFEEEGEMRHAIGETAIARKCFQKGLELYEAMVASGAAVPIDVYDRITRLSGSTDA